MAGKSKKMGRKMTLTPDGENITVPPEDEDYPFAENTNRRGVSCNENGWRLLLERFTDGERKKPEK